MPERYIPHEHQCPVCGTVGGCENKYCKESHPSIILCEKQNCKDIWAAGIIHAFASDDILPCCGQKVGETPRGDRMVRDEEKVTCEGAEVVSA
jgi:predicted nucleic acid-binding Zn ribbon protein